MRGNIVKFVEVKTPEVMTTIELKSDLHGLIDKVNDKTILKAIKAILSQQVKEVDVWEELPQKVQESVKRGMKQAEAGNMKSHKEVMQKYEQWL